MPDKKKRPSRRGGPRPNSGRPRIENPATMQLRLEESEKTAFQAAAEKSPERTLTQWVLAACREKLKRMKS